MSVSMANPLKYFKVTISAENTIKYSKINYDETVYVLQVKFLFCCLCCSASQQDTIKREC